MTARSVVLSVLLGAHPAWATASELIRLTADFDIKEATLRVALTRMVGAGDLVRSEDGYRLSDRLLARQRRQDDAINPQLRSWDGTWTTLVITSVGIDARTRAASADRRCSRTGSASSAKAYGCDRTTSRLALPRRGAFAGAGAARVRRQPRRTGSAAVGSGGLGAHRQATAATTCSTAADIPGRFVAAAGMVRHLLTDPVLPDELLPDGWPGAELRQSYAQFAAELVARRNESELMEAL